MKLAIETDKCCGAGQCVLLDSQMTSMPSKALALTAESPLMNVSSNRSRTALAFSSMTAASRSWMLERVATR